MSALGRPEIDRRRFLVGAAAVSASAVVGACGGSAPAVGDLMRGAVPTITVRYGGADSQVVDVWVPTGRRATPSGAVVLLHGGYWRAGDDRRLMSPLAADVAARGWVAWNVDYRPAGTDGGGWPGSFGDVAAGIDLLADRASTFGIDADRVAVVGHAGGGTFSLWAAARRGLPKGAPGAGPAVEPVVAVSQAGVNNLIAGVFEDVGVGAVVKLMGAEPDAAGDRYTLASPVERLPIGVPQVIVYGMDDTIVPSDQSTAYAAKAKKSGDDVTLLAISGADHYDLVDPHHPAWTRVAGRLTPLLTP